MSDSDDDTNVIQIIISDVGAQGPVGPASEIDGGSPTATGPDIVDGGTP